MTKTAAQLDDEHRQQLFRLIEEAVKDVASASKRLSELTDIHWTLATAQASDATKEEWVNEVRSAAQLLEVLAQDINTKVS